MELNLDQDFATFDIGPAGLEDMHYAFLLSSKRIRYKQAVLII